MPVMGGSDGLGEGEAGTGIIEFQRQKTLLKTSALQDAIFNSAYFSSIATDEKGVIQIFNVGAERMLGYAASDVVNKITPADISDPQELISRAERLSAELETPITPGFEALVFKASRGIEDIYELTYIRRDGSRFPAMVSVTVLHDARNLIIGYLLIGTDNTARKQVEAAQALLDQQLRDQQFYTRSLIESNIDALMTTDPQGIISDVNQQMIALTGYSRAELIGAPCRDFFTDPLRADAAIRMVLMQNRVSNYELTVRAKNGVETVVSYNAATFHDRDRKLQGVFAAARDVTERKRFEIALEEKNIELEHASRMKSEFLATMSHELRTPLNAIIGFSEALQDGLIGPVSETQQEYIGDIFTSGQHLLSLINDILDLSKVEAGMMELELESADLESLLYNSLSIVREKAAANRVRLELEIGDDLSALHLDTRKTKQIVYNLLSNAVKFSGNGGVVMLTARRVPRAMVGSVHPSWATHGFPPPPGAYDEFLEISVTDAGIGISRDNLQKLFMAFSQIDSSLARRFEGTGLGLAMVKQLAELHGGTVAVASEEGAGARFTVWLPLRLGAAKPVQDTRPKTIRNHGGRRIALVVEDDATAADLIRLLLEAEGFSVVLARSAEAALVMAPAHNLSLITIDIRLPGMDGWEFLRRLREVPALVDVAVVVIAGEADRCMALASDAVAVLQKPIGRPQLKTALAHLQPKELQNGAPLILLVHQDSAASDAIADILRAPGYTVMQAPGTPGAIELAQRLLPDLILLAPEVEGIEMVGALKDRRETRAIPVLFLTPANMALRKCSPLLDNEYDTSVELDRAELGCSAFITSVKRALEPTTVSGTWPEF